MPLLDPTTGLKICSKCSQEKTADCFAKCAAKTDKLAVWCRECYSKEYEKRKRKNQEIVKAATPPKNKKCTVCGEIKPIESFSKKSCEKDGYSYCCKSCASTSYYSDRERNIARSTRWRENNPESYAAYRKDYYGRPETKEKKKKYIEENRDWYLSWLREWYVENKEELKVSRLEYYDNNPEARKRKSEYRSAARAKKKNALVFGEIIPTVELLRDRDGDLCYYCQRTLSFELVSRKRGATIPKDAVEVEHKTPLSRGGKHTLKNTVLACNGCNSEKYNKTEQEYIEFRKNRINKENTRESNKL